MDTSGFHPVWTVIIPAVFGLLSGVVGTLVAPWVKWGIEKRREKLKRRQEIIKNCREKIYEMDKLAFRETPEYRYIRPYLNKQAIRVFEDPNVVWAQKPGHPDPLRMAIMDAVQELEQEWGLI